MHVAGRRDRDIFNTTPSPLSQASVHLLWPLCLSHVNRPSRGNNHYKDFAINLMNQKNQIRKNCCRYLGERVYFLVFILFSYVINWKCKTQGVNFGP